MVTGKPIAEVARDLGINDGIGCEDPTKGPGAYPAKVKPTRSSTPTEKSTPKPDTTKKADVPKSVPAGL